jgi:hypothetical protein
MPAPVAFTMRVFFLAFCGTNMHSLWDSGIIERVSRAEDYWLTELAALDTPEGRQEAIRGTIEEWATEKPAGRQGSLPESSDRHADEARRETGRPVLR